MFDKEQTGRINLQDFDTIMLSLHRDTDEARRILTSDGQEKIEEIPFDHFVEVMKQLEKQQERLEEDLISEQG